MPTHEAIDRPALPIGQKVIDARPKLGLGTDIAWTRKIPVGPIRMLHHRIEFGSTDAVEVAEIDFVVLHCASFVFFEETDLLSTFCSNSGSSNPLPIIINLTPIGLHTRLI